MERLCAHPSRQLGNEFVEYMTTLAPRQVLNILEKEGWKEYMTTLAPRQVLNILEKEGWKVVGMAGIGQTCAWTLHRDY
nr:GTP cyclohydrolase I domain containing protein [Haemonchus contortus]